MTTRERSYFRGFIFGSTLSSLTWFGIVVVHDPVESVKVECIEPGEAVVEVTTPSTTPPVRAEINP